MSMKNRTVHERVRLKRENEADDASNESGSMPLAKSAKSSASMDEASALEVLAHRISASWQKAVESIIETGKLLIEAKCQVGHGNWLEFVEKKLPFGDRTADCLMEIARHPILSNSKFVSKLPPSWGTLHRLTDLDERELEELLENGTINCETTKNDVDEQIKRISEEGIYKYENVSEALGTLCRFMTKWPNSNEIASRVYEHMIEGDHTVDLPDIPKLCKWLSCLHQGCQQAKRDLDNVPAEEETAPDAGDGSLNRTARKLRNKQGFVPSSGERFG
jgi:hypothetical protein